MYFAQWGLKWWRCPDTIPTLFSFVIHMYKLLCHIIVEVAEVAALEASIILKICIVNFVAIMRCCAYIFTSL